MNQKLELKLSIRLLTEDHQRCFGPGVATLLEQVAVHHSLRAAAGAMEMAYSKAWRIIRTAEEALGCKLLDSTIGGKHGGGAALTPEALQLLSAYRAYQADVEAYARQKFDSSFLELFSDPSEAK